MSQGAIGIELRELLADRNGFYAFESALFVRGFGPSGGELLDDYNYLTGYPLAKEWQEAHGPLEPGQRLVAVQPFVLGGAFAVDNLRPMRDHEAMTSRGALAQQLRGKPDGTRFRVEPTA